MIIRDYLTCLVLVGRLACYRELAADGDGVIFFGNVVAAGKRRREIARVAGRTDGWIFFERQFARNLGSLTEQMSCLFSIKLEDSQANLAG